MAYFPFFMDLSGRRGLVAGGGPVALRKIQKLLPYGPSITVAAGRISPEIAAIPGLELVREDFSPALLEGRFFVIAATDNRTLNREIAALCAVQGILVNAVDDREACTFLFPALAKRGDLSVGVSTGGASPSGAAWVRDRIEGILPERFGELLAFLDEKRQVVKDALPDEGARSACLKELFAACLQAGRPLEEAEFLEILHRFSGFMSKTPGTVYLVGAGCGGADMITVRGLRLLERCGVVVYDDLLDKAILEAVPEGAEKIYVGKRQGRHSAAQEEICALLIEKAREGKTVVRLKGGDPFVFGRGGEEMLALRAAGIPCQEVPGVTSAIAVPALAGIPVTHRQISRSVHIITARTADTPGGLPEDLEALAGLRGTLVFLMGVSRLEELSARLLAAGMAPETPAAVVSEHMAVRGTLADIGEKGTAVPPPAVIVVGETAAMDVRGAGQADG